MAFRHRVTLLSDPRFFDHDTGGGEHPETPTRLAVINDRLAGVDFVAPDVLVSAPVARQWLQAVHDEAYLLRFEEVALSGREYLGHPDNQLCVETYGVALLAAGAGPVAIDGIESGRCGTTFCAVRPPGHHAERAMALGFCFLNNVAVAARYWQQAHGRRRILIVDFDAHHGNGIQAAFEEEPDVLYVSIHEHPTFSFPSTGYADECGTGPGRGATLNIPLPPGASDPMVIAAIDTQLEPAVRRFCPEAIIVAAGFDGHHLDDMSGLAYSTDLYRVLGERLAVWADRYCSGRLLSLLEGGYHLDALADSVAAYLAGLVAG